MKIFLTGANGFVGSHVLEALLASGHDVAALIRRTSDTRFIAERLTDVEVRYGDVCDVSSLRRAMWGANAVVHCAGKTKALRVEEFFRVNRDGVRNVALAANTCADTLRHVVLISSLAASGPGLPDDPAVELDPPRPVSPYGASKLAGEVELKSRCEIQWTILRPSAVYGPRDLDFLSAFQAVKGGLLPLFDRGRQPLSLVYAADVADAVVCCLGREAARKKTYHVAGEPSCTSAELLREIALHMECEPRRVNLPTAVLYPVCLAQHALSRLRGRPHILSLYKWPELRAPGWVCSTERIREDLGFQAATSLAQGIAKTLAWYREWGWL